MKKATLLKYLFQDYQSVMDRKEYEDLKNEVVQFEKQIKAENVSEMAAGINANFPQFQIMHQAFMRNKASKISSDISFIKVILIIFAVLTLVGAIAMAAQIK